MYEMIFVVDVVVDENVVAVVVSIVAKLLVLGTVQPEVRVVHEWSFVVDKRAPPWSCTATE
jgi:hypothetical protein